MTDIELVVKSVVDQYSNEIPFSVALSLCGLTTLYADTFPVRYKTHFEPFIKYSDITTYKIECQKDSDKTVRFKLTKIQIGPLDYDSDELLDELNDLVCDLKIFNFEWRDKYDTEEYSEWVLDQNVTFKETKIRYTTLIVQTI